MQASGGYDLLELRRKLEQRMEYSKVQSLPHDPRMDPDETIPSYASSTEAMEREAAMRQMGGGTGRGMAAGPQLSSDEED